MRKNRKCVRENVREKIGNVKIFFLLCERENVRWSERVIFLKEKQVITPGNPFKNNKKKDFTEVGT